MVNEIAESIARMEGFYTPGTLARINNNPGNLRTWGSLPIRNGFAVFPTEEAGWNALRRQVQLLIDRGLNLYEFFGGKPGVYPGYAPAADNNKPRQYAEFVAGRVGIDPSVAINEYSDEWESDGPTGGAVNLTSVAIVAFAIAAIAKFAATRS